MVADVAATSHRARPLAELLDVVIITHNRRQRLLQTIAATLELDERPGLIVIDNGSTDGTAAAVRSSFGDAVRLVEADHNHGAAGRNIGVELSGRDYVAFCDDDMIWTPGSLSIAYAVLESHPQLAAVVGRMVIGPTEQTDPISDVMAASPLPAAGLPGPSVAGMVAGASVVRRSAFLAVGGFHPMLRIGGEEELTVLDLMAGGWRLCYLHDAVVQHAPAPRDRTARSRAVVRSRLLTAWMRYPADLVGATTWGECRRVLTDRASAAGVASALRHLPWALRQRRRLPAEVNDALRTLRRHERPPGVRGGGL